MRSIPKAYCHWKVGEVSYLLRLQLLLFWVESLFWVELLFWVEPLFWVECTQLRRYCDNYCRRFCEIHHLNRTSYEQLECAIIFVLICKTKNIHVMYIYDRIDWVGRLDQSSIDNTLTTHVSFSNFLMKFTNTSCSAYV